MKLLVIVLCLLSERYLIHAVSLNRFNWFKEYYQLILNHAKKLNIHQSPWLVIALMVLPLFISLALILWIFEDLVFGFTGLILHIIILYYCLGPQNPFYPISETPDKTPATPDKYLADVNGQLFAVLFWYILTGPLGIIVYRTVSLCQNFDPSARQAEQLTAIFDWLPARLTVILYMLVGNFQRGLHHLSQHLIAAPAENETLLKNCGLASLRSKEDEQVSIAAAENLVEHSVIVFLVLLALFTLASWL